MKQFWRKEEGRGGKARAPAAPPQFEQSYCQFRELLQIPVYIV